MENRRDFLRAGAQATAGLAVAGLLPQRTFAQDGAIRYRELGSTGFKVSEIGFGAMNMRDPELVRAAFDSGINYFDTAHRYMNGVNEQIVGQALKGNRDKIFLTTKLPGNDAAAIPRLMELSLQRLQTDHVDLVLLHNLTTSDEVTNSAVMDAFVAIREKGQARFIGVSTHTNQATVMDAAVETGVWEAVLTGYSYVSPPEVTASIEKARTAGLAIIAMKNLLNTETRPRTTFGDIRTENQQDMTPTQALLKWVLNNPNVDTTIPGMTSFEHLTEDLAIMGMQMGFEDERELRRFGERTSGSRCLSVAGCTACQDQCPKGVSIRDINRCIGYAHGYGDMSLAWENYRELPARSKIETCGDCDECVVRCANGIDLTASVREARRLFA